MAQFIALDPNVEMKGEPIFAVVESLGDNAIPILKKYNLYPVDLEKWYPQQDWLDAFKEIDSHNFLNLVAIGMKIPDTAVWPPHISTVHEALESINVAYQMNHRGGNIGGYHYTRLGEREGKMVCDNPYPSDFDYGLIYRTVQKFRDNTSQHFTITRNNDEPNRSTGADVCVYQIKW